MFRLFFLLRLFNHCRLNCRSFNFNFKTKIKQSLNYREAIAMALMKENVTAYLNFSKGALSIEVPNNKRAIDLPLPVVPATSKWGILVISGHITSPSTFLPRAKVIVFTLDLLDDYPESNNVNTSEIDDNKRTIVETLTRFKISSEVPLLPLLPMKTRELCRTRKIPSRPYRHRRHRYNQTSPPCLSLRFQAAYIKSRRKP